MTFVRDRDHARQHQRREGVLCDACSARICRIEHAVLRLVYDHRELVVRAEVDHVSCSGARGVGPGERVETIRADDLANQADLRTRVRSLARLQGASAGRAIRKVDRLARGGVP